MGITTVTVGSVSALWTEIDKIADPARPAVSRGQASADWGLQPPLDRDVDPAKGYVERLAEERRLVDQFCCEAEHLLGPVELAYVRRIFHNDLVAPLTVMQHYGAPTRLLDWSTSPLVAAFFAAVGKPDQDGAVWWFRAEAFDKAATAQWKRLGMQQAEGADVNYNDFAFHSNSSEFLGVVGLKLPFARAQAQQGLFTFAGRLGLKHDELLVHMLGVNNCGKIVMPASGKRDALTALAARNVTAASLLHTGADRLGLRLAWERARFGLTGGGTT